MSSVMPNNKFGLNGTVSLPNARLPQEGELSFQFYRGFPDRKLLLSASPYSWLQANIFYTDIAGKDYPGYFQSYKDKGFSVKIGLLREGYILPELSMGFDDFAGTGIFSRQYIVATKGIGRSDFSLGIGSGNLSSGRLRINNPFKPLFNDLGDRFAQTEQGGMFNFGNYFSSDDLSVFYSVKHKVNNSFEFSLEYDPTIYGKRQFIKKIPKTRYNFGLKWKINNNNSIQLGIERGQEITANIVYKDNFFQKETQSQLSRPTKPLILYSNIQEYLNSQGIGVKLIQEKELSNKSIAVEIFQNSFIDIDKLDKELFQAFRENSDYDSVEVIHKKYSMVVKESKLNLDKPFIIDDKIIRNNDRTVYQVNESFPYIFNKLGPKIKTFVAAREGFNFQGLMLEHDSEIILNHNFFIQTNLKYSVYDNFDKLFIPPDRTFPNQVRSDTKKYFNNFDKGITIGRLQANYFFSPYENNYFALSAGIYEEMFMGSGIDYIYQKNNSRFHFGFDYYYLKKRSHRMLFDVLGYDNHIYKIKAGYLVPKLDFLFSVKYGEFLAGDVGTKFEFSRTYRNGTKLGLFFTLTDVSFAAYGEGSFDKGVYFKIPLDNILNTGFFEYLWRPLTKDPGATLNNATNLFDEISRYKL